VPKREIEKKKQEAGDSCRGVEKGVLERENAGGADRKTGL